MPFFKADGDSRWWLCSADAFHVHAGSCLGLVLRTWVCKGSNGLASSLKRAWWLRVFNVRPLSAHMYRALKYQSATVGWPSASKPQKWYVFTSTPYLDPVKHPHLLLRTVDTQSCCPVKHSTLALLRPRTSVKCFTVPSSFQPPTSYVPRWLLPRIRIRIRICIRALILILPLLESTHFSFLQLPISSGLRSHHRLRETTIPSPVSCVPGHDTPIRMRDTIDPRLTA